MARCQHPANVMLACNSRSRLSQRCAYTLVEMLIVVAIIMVLATLAFPMLSKPYGKAELRESAKLLRAQLQRLRAKAVETGRPYFFRFRPGSQQFETGPLDALFDQNDLSGISESASGAGSVESDDETLSTDAASTVVDQLASNIVFALAEQLYETTRLWETKGVVGEGTADGLVLSASTDQENDAVSELAQSALAADGADWSEPIVFFPDGRCSKNASIRLLAQDRYYIDVFLHAASGQVIIGQLNKMTQTEGLQEGEGQPWQQPVGDMLSR